MENNVNALRAALVEIDKLTSLLDIPDDKKNLLVSPSHSFIAVKMRTIIKKALEEAPRNCDRLSADQCKKIFISEMEIYLLQEATDRDRDIARCTAYGVIDALFAPYAEQKGEDE